MSDPFDFDAVDSSSAQVVGSPARRRSPARGRAGGYGRSKGIGRGGGGRGLGSPPSASGASVSAPSPPRTRTKDNLDFGHDEGNATDDDSGDAGSIASSSVASSTLSFGAGSRTSTGRAGAGGGGRSKMKKKQSASAKLQSRLQQMRKREAEEEAERLVDDYASIGKRSVTSGGSGSVVGTSRRRKKAAAAATASSNSKGGREKKSGRKVTSTQQRHRQQQQDRKRPGSAFVADNTADDDTDDDTNDALLEDMLDDDTRMKSRADGQADDGNGCNSRAGTPKAHGGSRSGTGSGSRTTRSTAAGDRGFDGMMVDTSAKDEMEPCSQSSFLSLSLSASPYKRSNQPQDSDDDNDDDDASSAAFSHVSNASSARGGRKRVVIRRGRGAYGSHQQSQSSSITGVGSAFGGDFDDIGSISTAGNSSVGSDAVLGGGVDVFAMQDAGTYRMLSDDCSYLCETILSAMKSDGDDTFDPVIRHTSVTADACCDLAVLFSSARNRAVLLRTAKIMQSDRSGNGPGSQPDEGSEVDNRRGRDALDSILDAISCAPFPPLSVVDGGDDSARAPATAVTKENGDAVVAAVRRTAKSRRGRAAASAGKGESKASINFGTRSSPPEHGELNPYDRVAAHSLSVLAYYLSLECSRGDRSALREVPAAAKRVRRRVLRNGPALRGVSRMVQLDPLVEAVLGSSPKSSGPIDGADTSVETLNKKVSDVDTSSDASSASKRTNGVKRCREDGNDAEEKESLDAERRAIRDPTKAGRRKKRGKKRRLLLGKDSNENELETIPEDDGSRMSNEEAAELYRDAGAASGLSQLSPASVQAPGGQSKQSELSQERANLDFLLSDGRSPDQGAAMADAGAKRTGAAASNPISAHDKNVERLNRKVLKATSKLAKRTNLNDDDAVLFGATPCSNVDCSHHRTSGNITSRGSGHLALGALSRLLTGKDKDGGAHGDGDDEGDDEDEHQSDDDSDGAHSDGDDGNDVNNFNVDEENDLSNPLMFTNIMLRRSGSLPHLARAVSDTFASIVCLISDNDGKETTYCETSINHLRKRASSLFSIIDGASCLSSENRKQFCQTKGGAALINNLLSLISAVPFSLEMSSAAISDIILSALRTLTSLTHENPLAAEQMLQTRKLRWISSEVDAIAVEPTKLSVVAEESCLTGVGIILYNLHRMVTAQKEKTPNEKAKGVSDESRDKHCYDVVIFCLNILTNVVEMASFHGARRQIYESRVPKEGVVIDGQSSSSSLAWLASWLTDQTTSYRDAVMKGSFGDEGLSLSHGANEPRDLEKHEEEYLVTAGNGFILLAYLMKADDEVDTVGDELTMSIRETILSQMPTDDEGRDIGITLMIKTLKAFCNFYHFSIGPLSVAIVTPVLKLIKDLENIQSLIKSKSKE